MYLCTMNPDGSEESKQDLSGSQSEGIEYAKERASILGRDVFVYSSDSERRSLLAVCYADGYILEQE